MPQSFILRCLSARGSQPQAELAPMIDVNTASNRELDDGVQTHDARQGERMLRAVYDFIGRFISYPSDHARVAHTLWIGHCHLMDKWDTSPRISFLSPEPASGKSRALEITELLVPRPVPTVNASSAYIFRKIGSEDGRPTILFDEIDAIFGPKAQEHEDLRALLNAGHKRGSFVGRCVTAGKKVETEEMPAFSAVALAGLGSLPDTILSRSVIVRMRRRRPDERIEPFRSRLHAEEGYRIRDSIERWAATVPAEIEYPELPAAVVDRDADVWEPLLTVATLIGGEWPARARAAALALLKVAHEFEPSLGLRLLEDMREVFGDDDAMATASILGKLLALDESPWGDIRGKPLDARGLARLLKEHGIKSKVLRVGDGTIRGHNRRDFADAWARYLSPIPGKHVTSVTAKQDPQNAHKTGPVSAMLRSFACYVFLEGQRGAVKQGLPPWGRVGLMMTLGMWNDARSVHLPTAGCDPRCPGCAGGRPQSGSRSR
jgi:Protein of unknown function (DUF3631)